MADHYYFAYGAMPSGPWTVAEMRTLAAGGHIDPQNLIWQAGTADRVQASQMETLFLSNPSPDAEPKVPAQDGGATKKGSRGPR
jgi:hypothetical protein